MRLGIVGTGSVGVSFVLALEGQEDIELTGLVASTWEKTVAAGKQYGLVPYRTGAALAADSDVLLLTVTDDAIASVSQSIVAALETKDYRGQGVVLHCSGAMGLEPLAPWRHVGWAIGSLHPLQSFARPDGQQLRHIYMASDGDAAAQEITKTLARLLDSTTFTVPAAERPSYHAAACFASNFVVTAAVLGQALLSRWTDTPADAAKALQPLLAGTMANLARTTDFSKALTGPIARGDVGTVQKHVDALPKAFDGAYRDFALQTARVALANQFISKDQYDQFASILAIGKGDSHEPESQHPHDC